MKDLSLASLREEEFRKLYDQIGAKRFEIAVNNAIRWHATGFYPSLAEFMKYVPDPPADDTLTKKIEKWKAEYEAAQSDPEYQAELALLKARFKQLTRQCEGGE